MKVFCHYLKQALYEKLSLEVDVFAFKKERHAHLAFKLPISDYESFDKMIDFISGHWEKRKVFFDDYQMVYLRLISSIKFTFDYVFFEKKKRNAKTTKHTRKQLCDKIVDVIGETFIKKYYPVKIFQSQKDMFILWLEKNEGNCLVKNCLHFIARFMTFPGLAVSMTLFF